MSTEIQRIDPFSVTKTTIPIFGVAIGTWFTLMLLAEPNTVESIGFLFVGIVLFPIFIGMISIVLAIGTGLLAVVYNYVASRFGGLHVTIGD